MRGPYICPDCDQRSTRWWNLKIHMKRKHGGFLLGKSSDRYMANNPPLYNKSVQLGHATIADTSFQPRYIPQQAPLGISQFGTNPMHTIHDQSYGTGLSPETTHKINELKRLVYKYREYQNTDPDEIVKWAINGALKGDTQFLDKKLEQLHTIDTLAKY
jgi:Zinc finger, C2H2 type